MIQHCHQTITGCATGPELDARLREVRYACPAGSLAHSRIPREVWRAMDSVLDRWPREWCRSGERSTFTGWLRTIAPYLTQQES